MEISAHDHLETAIVGLWSASDYGSTLSAYALYKTVEGMGYSPVFLNPPKEYLPVQENGFDDEVNPFLQKNCYIAPELYGQRELEEFIEQRKNFLVGSGTVWNVDGYRQRGEGFFFLDFVPDYMNKISYASRFRGVLPMPVQKKRQIQNWLERITHRSVGDYAALRTMNMEFQLKAECLLDPLFLYNSYSFVSQRPIHTPYIFTYFERCDGQRRKIVEMAEETRDCPSLNFAGISHYEDFRQNFGGKIEPSTKLEDWVTALWHAEIVLTDTYAAACIAIILHKPFVILTERSLQNINPFIHLMHLLHLEERLVYIEEDLEERRYLLKKPVNYLEVDKILNPLVEASKDWLLRSLGNDHFKVYIFIQIKICAETMKI